MTSINDLQTEARLEALAMMAYMAYEQSVNRKSYSGDGMPEWKHLPEKIQKAWKDSIWAVLVNFV